MNQLKHLSFILFIGLFGLMGCTHLVSLSTTSVPPKAVQTKKIYAESDRFMFFLFNFDNDYVDNISLDLARQCPKGKVQGVLTKHESVTYFPLIAHKVKVSANGYCVR